MITSSIADKKIPITSALFAAYSGEEVVVFSKTIESSTVLFKKTLEYASDLSINSSIFGLIIKFSSGGSITFHALTDIDKLRGLSFDSYTVNEVVFYG